MTDQELDSFFTDTLKAILADTKECALYTKNLHTPEYEEINEDYAETIDFLTDLLSRCNSIDELAQMDDEAIDFVYELLATYSDNFIIEAEEPAHSRSLEEYKKLEELLDLFLDDYNEEEEE